MKSYYGLLLVTLAIPVIAWWVYGLIPGLAMAGMWVAGYATKKHRAYVEAAAAAPRAYVEQKFSAWFGS